MPPKPDIQTKNIITEDERIARFVNSDDWKAVRKIFIKKILDNDSVSTFITDGTALDKLGVELLARAQASAILKETLLEIEGRAIHSVTLPQLLRGDQEEQLITYFERSETEQ